MAQRSRGLSLTDAEARAQRHEDDLTVQGGGRNHYETLDIQLVDTVHAMCRAI